MKKILMPIDDSIHSIHALKYMSMLSSITDDLTYLLFHVQPIVSDYLEEEAKKDPKAMGQLKKLGEKNAAHGREVLNRYKERMMQINIPEEKIELSTQRRIEGIARDIIHQAYRESVDAIAMGRRGFSKLQESFIGSTTKNVIDHTTDIPVWVVDGEIITRDILLAVDGSTDSFRALEHLCSVLKPDPDVKLTLFHVQPSLRDCCGIDSAARTDQGDDELISCFIKVNRQCIDNFAQRAIYRLKQSKIPEDRVAIKIHPTNVNIGRSIVEEFKNGRYGTLVVGKRGVNKRFFMGSISHYLITHLGNGALWVVP